MRDKSVVQPHKTELFNRLKRIEGQVRGIQRMIEEDRYCIDILFQVAAVKSAMNQVALKLMEDHTRHCVSKAIKNNNEDDAIDELMDVVKRLTK
ncbi:metal-sensitive transcriptional regulator [Novibacillus thermophilus]|jgi:DNA-binding FrmR family transcriptional regulator|uniref:Transcriptional regulator n=1 Tax=Novibacillus thermophilus TaxID=1471761 RepID=A0A1U9K652_9BACL|nr:metal-sensitive transcriptional regulator [Novibacillus thermophilus]AQS55496.1 transcriptional regulator [Novibacillus thermophilus]